MSKTEDLLEFIPTAPGTITFEDNGICTTTSVGGVTLTSGNALQEKDTNKSKDQSNMEQFQIENKADNNDAGQLASFPGNVLCNVSEQVNGWNKLSAGMDMDEMRAA